MEPLAEREIPRAPFLEVIVGKEPVLYHGSLEELNKMPEIECRKLKYVHIPDEIAFVSSLELVDPNVWMRIQYQLIKNNYDGLVNMTAGIIQDPFSRSKESLALYVQGTPVMIANYPEKERNQRSRKKR